MDGWTDVRTDGWMDGCMHAWMDRQMGGWMDGWMVDEWTQLVRYLCRGWWMGGW